MTTARKSTRYSRSKSKALGVRDKDSPEAPLILLSGEQCFANQLFSKVVSKEFHCPCEIKSESETLLGSVELVLVDCQALTETSIALWLHNNLSLCQHLALFNVPFHQHFERLIEWPKINGLFYEGTKEPKILEGCRRILAGELWLPRRLLASHLLSCRNDHPVLANSKLTQRETQCMKLMKAGATNSEIGDQLGLTENTVKSHLYKAYRKIGASNRFDAANWARIYVE